MCVCVCVCVSVCTCVHACMCICKYVCTGSPISITHGKKSYIIPADVRWHVGFNPEIILIF